MKTNTAIAHIPSPLDCSSLFWLREGKKESCEDFPFGLCELPLCALRCYCSRCPSALGTLEPCIGMRDLPIFRSNRCCVCVETPKWVLLNICRHFTHYCKNVMISTRNHSNFDHFSYQYPQINQILHKFYKKQTIQTRNSIISPRVCSFGRLIVFSSVRFGLLASRDSAMRRRVSWLLPSTNLL